MVESRYTDQVIVKCHRCGWTGKIADCRHGYISILGYDALDPQDFCPACSSVDLEDREDIDDNKLI